MFRVLKRAVLAVAVVANLALGVAPALAASGPTTLSFGGPTSVAPGATFTVPVNISTAGTTLGWQFGVTYDSTALTLTSVTLPANDFLTAYTTATDGSVIQAASFTPVASPGQSKVGGYAIVGASGAGPTGSGTLVNLNFTATAGVNAIAAISLSSVLVNGINAADLTLPTGSITVGTPPAADLVVIGAATAAVSGTPTEFNVTFAIKNQGNASASTAGVTSLAVTGATPASATVPAPAGALAAGASTATLTAGPFTLNSGVSLGNVTINADSTSLVAESNEANNSVTSAYQYSALSASGNTNIAANLAATISLTAPAAISNFVLVPGTTNQFPDGNLSINSNVNFQVTVADANAANNGHLTEYDGSQFVAGGAQLINALVIQPNNASAQDVTVSGLPQNLVNGTRAAEPASGYAFPIDFIQSVGFNDAPVNAPHFYYEVVTFSAAGTF